MKRVSEALKKSGFLLDLLGPEMSKTILNHLTQEQSDQLLELLTKQPSIKTEKRIQMLIEFKTRMQREQILVVESWKENESSFLSGVPLDLLAQVLKNENPQLLALVAFYLGEKRSQAFLQHFPKGKQIMIRERISTLRPVTPSVLKVLEQTILERLSLEKMNQLNPQERSRFINHLVGKDGESKDNLLKTLERENPKTYRQLWSLIAPFEDLKEVSKEKLTQALERVSHQDLVVSLKAASVEVKNKLMESIKEPLRSQTEQEISRLGAVPLKQIESAQQKVLLAVSETSGDVHVESH